MSKHPATKIYSILLSVLPNIENIAVPATQFFSLLISILDELPPKDQDISSLMKSVLDILIKHPVLETSQQGLSYIFINNN